MIQPRDLKQIGHKPFIQWRPLPMAANILVVEDEPAIQELIAVNLQHAGHHVMRAGDAEGAPRHRAQCPPDLADRLDAP
jgi:CheY-like chemotaxis protein